MHIRKKGDREKMPFGDRGFDRGPREMHKAVCTECKQECEVPFKPTQGKPVFCRECFQKKNPRKF